MTSTPPSPPSREGQVLSGRYRLGGLIGRGGMAEVYRATDQTLGRPVAVKILTNAANAEAVDRHAAEAQIGARLNHPGLVAVYDVSTDHDPPFLVMELVQGITLADALERGPLAPIAVAEIGAQLLGALAVVHRNDVLHRDIKPSNVMVAEGDDPVVKLTDFGISRLIDSTRLTSTGLLVGTARYLSPEQAAGETVGAPTDVYAGGLVLLECLTGVQAFPGTQVETLSARLHRQPDIPDSLGPGWKLVLDAMTQRDPAARPDAAEASRALRTLAEGGMPSLAPRPAGGTRAMGAGAAGAAGAAAAMGATQAMGATGPQTAATQVTPAAASTPPTGTQATAAGTAPDEPGKGRRNALIVAGVVAVVLLVALGAWALNQPGNPDEPQDTPTTTAPTTDEPTQDEPTQDEEPTEEPTTEEPTEEPTTEEPTEEPTTEEPTEEPTTEEPTEEPTADESSNGNSGSGNGNGGSGNGGSGNGGSDDGGQAAPDPGTDGGAGDDAGGGPSDDVADGGTAPTTP